MRMLEAEPQERFPCCFDVASSLRGYLDACPEQSSSTEVAAFVQTLCGDLLAERTSILGSGSKNFLIRLERSADETLARPSSVAVTRSARSQEPEPSVTRRVSSRYRRYAITGAVSAALLSFSFAAWLFREEKPKPLSPIVLVEHRPAQDQAAASQAPPAPAARSPGEREDGRQSLSRAFARRKDAIEECVTGSSIDVSSTSSISIRFGVDTEGKVTSAEIIPGALNATAFGECVLRTARSTRFPRQPSPISFRIPVTLSKSKPSPH